MNMHKAKEFDIIATISDPPHIDEEEIIISAPAGRFREALVKYHMEKHPPVAATAKTSLLEEKSNADDKFSKFLNELGYPGLTLEERFPA